MICSSSASSFGIFRNLTKFGRGSANVSTQAGYSPLSLTTGGSCPLRSPRPFRTVPAFIGRAGACVLPKHRKAASDIDGVPATNFDEKLRLDASILR